MVSNKTPRAVSVMDAINVLMKLYPMIRVLNKHGTLMVAGDHPELDNNPIVVQDGVDGQLEVDLFTKLREQYLKAEEMLNKKEQKSLIEKTQNK
eukprot:15362137-Ditylum_brightwellii.AAC.1